MRTIFSEDRKVFSEDRNIFFRPESTSEGFPENHAFFRSEFDYESHCNPEEFEPKL